MLDSNIPTLRHIWRLELLLQFAHYTVRRGLPDLARGLLETSPLKVLRVKSAARILIFALFSSVTRAPFRPAHDLLAYGCRSSLQKETMPPLSLGFECLRKSAEISKLRDFDHRNRAFHRHGAQQKLLPRNGVRRQSRSQPRRSSRVTRCSSQVSRSLSHRPLWLRPRG